MKVLLAPVLLCWLGSLPTSTQGQATMPGMQQWQRYMQQHAVAEGRSPSQITQDKHRGLWQAQIDKVRSEEQQLRDKFGGIQKNRQEEISNILTDNVATKEGIKEIIKHLLKAKIEETKVENSEKSVLEQLIQRSPKISRKSNTERPTSFLDHLSAIYSPNTETSVYINDNSDELENVENEYDYKDFEYFESGQSSQIDILDDNEKEYEHGLESFESEQSSLIDILDDNEEDYEHGLESILRKHNLIESERSSLVDSSDDISEEGKRPKIIIKEEDFLTTEEDIAKNFLAEEISSAQSETKELVVEMEKMLAVLEAEATSDSKLLEKTLGIIKSKVGSSSLQDLLGDTDFKNSVFYRFAIMKLPLRDEDIPVAELAEVKKVVRNNIIATAEETRDLLKELKKDITEGSKKNEEARAQRSSQGVEKGHNRGEQKK